MGEAAAKRLLRDGGLPVPEGVELELGDEDGCVAAASELGWPVALKLSGRAVRHKTDTGALALGIAADEDLRRARGRLASLPEADGASLLVERMAEPGIELLISARADAVVPVVTVGLGGIWTEALRGRGGHPPPRGRPAGRGGDPVAAGRGSARRRQGR